MFQGANWLENFWQQALLCLWWWDLVYRLWWGFVFKEGLPRCLTRL